MQSRERYFVPPNQSIDDIPIDIKHLYFCGNNDDIDKLDFSALSFTNLKSITIGQGCLKDVREFVIDGLESLESVKIGDECFYIDNNERDDGLCRIMNCPNLRQLEIGDWSFHDYKSFELSNVNSIQSIKFGNSCFGYADFSLKGEWKEKKRKKCDLNANGNEALDLPSLEIVTFGECSFGDCHVAVFESMLWFSFHFSF